MKVVPAALVCALGAGLLVPVAAAPAQARGKVFTKPAALTVAASTSGSFTALAKVKGAKKYRIYAATTKREVNARSFKHAPWHSKWSKSKAVTISGLPYRTGPYYYRYAAKRPGKLKFSTMQAAYLTPPTPTGLTPLTAPGGGLTLRWSAAAAEKYVVVAATDVGLSDVVKTWTVHGNAHAFTPYGLSTGRQYYFRVRAINGSSGSSWSAPTTAKVPATSVPLRLMTYNLLAAVSDGARRDGGEKVADWQPDRRDAAAGLVRAADPDVLVMQEGLSHIGGYGNITQAASLVKALGGDWTLADNGDSTSDTFIAYRRGLFTAVQGAGGTITLPPDRRGIPWHAAYQLLQYAGSGPRVLVVSAHLLADASDDRGRQREAVALTDRVESLAKQFDAAVVYGGDFNSHSRHTLDGPGVTFAQHRIPDAYDVAPTVVNGQYNSANQYRRTPPHAFCHIDHIFAGPGVAVKRWQLLLRLSGSKFAGTIPSDHNPLVADLLLPA